MVADDERAGWFDDDPELSDRPKGARRRRLHLLLVAAGVPWLIVALLVFRGDATPRSHADGGPIPSTASESAWSEAASDGDGTDTSSGEDADADAAEVVPLPLSRGVEAATDVPVPAHGGLAAVATIAARAWLTGLDPVLAVEGVNPAADQYLEHLVVEAVERPTPGTSVVTLTAVVLEAVDGQFAARARRLAVPLAVEGELVLPAGTPWWLPEHELQAVSVPHAVVEDAALQLLAAEAVSDAGYLEVELLELSRTDGWPWSATVRASTPAGAEVDGTIWLREAVDGFVVVGAGPADAGSGGSDTGPTP